MPLFGAHWQPQRLCASFRVACTITLVFLLLLGAWATRVKNVNVVTKIDGANKIFDICTDDAEAQVSFAGCRAETARERKA